MDYNAYSFITDFAFMSLLLVVAQFLRGGHQNSAKPLYPFFSCCRNTWIDLRTAGFKYYSMER